MKRRILYLMMGLALIASLGFGVASPRGTAAYPGISVCDGYAIGFWYHQSSGNHAVAEMWWNEANAYGCGFEVSWNNIY
jgi:hypothetical protein